MSYPADKETFTNYVDRDLGTGEVGTRIIALDMNNLRDCVERIEDAVGYNFLAGYSDLAERLDNMPSNAKMMVWTLLNGG